MDIQIILLILEAFFFLDQFVTLRHDTFTHKFPMIAIQYNNILYLCSYNFLWLHCKQIHQLISWYISDKVAGKRIFCYHS